MSESLVQYGTSFQSKLIVSLMMDVKYTTTIIDILDISYFDSDGQVIVFSDDCLWCDDEAFFGVDRFLISESADNTIDLCLMTFCSDYIIANSSFSWWGARLSHNPSPKVIAPKKWFGPNNEHKNLKDLRPPTWITI